MVDHVVVNGVKLIMKSDKVVLCEKAGGFEPKTMALWLNTIIKGDYVVDAGAYTGIYSIAAKLAGASEVYSFEPNAKVYERLRNNAKLNEVELRTYPIALWHRFEILKFRAAENLSSAGRITRDAPRSTARVIGVPLDELNIPHCDLIKIDVERAEAAVIMGAVETIKRCRPRIITEVLNTDLFDAIFKLLDPLNYEHSGIEKDMVLWEPRL